MPPDERDSLRGKLEQAEHRLQAALGGVCEDPTVDRLRKPDTGELIRIEETLALAIDAAKRAITLRRRIKSDARKGHTEGETRPADGAK